MLKFMLDNFIKRHDLVPGQVYLWKDGHLRWYLGTNAKDSLCFYTLGRACLYTVNSRWNGRSITSDVVLMHENVQFPYLQQMITNTITSCEFISEACGVYCTMPSIYGVIPCKDAEILFWGWLKKHQCQLAGILGAQ